MCLTNGSLGAHTHSVDSILSMFLFELILSSEILCTLRCVTFINSTTSYDKQNACNRYGCWLSLMFIIFFLSILKNLPENIGWKKKKKASAISNSMMLIRWLWQKSMWPNKTKQTKCELAGKTDGAHAKKPTTTTNLNAIAWTEWKFVVCFSPSAICWNRNIWYIYACQRLIILIAHSNHFR